MRQEKIGQKCWMKKVNFPHEGKLFALMKGPRQGSHAMWADGLLKSTIKHNEWCLIAIKKLWTVLKDFETFSPWDNSYGVEMVDPLTGSVVDDAKGELGEGGERLGRWWFLEVGKGGKSVVSNEQSKFAPTTGDKKVATNTV